MIHKLFPGGNENSPAKRWTHWSAWLVFALSVAITLLCWRFSVAELQDDHHAAVSGLLLIAGLLISLLLSALTWGLVNTRGMAAKMAQEMSMSLRQSEERWSLAMAGLGGGVTDWNIETGETIYSSGWWEMLGLTEDDIGNSADEWMKRAHPDDMPLMTENMQALFDGRISRADLEFRMQCKDGSWKWIRGHAIIASRAADGMPLRLIGTNIDISERKQAEIFRDALLEAHEDAGVGLFAINHNKIVYANAAFVAITGYSIEELKALPNSALLVHPDDREVGERIYQQRLEGNVSNVRYEIGILTKSGERREAENASTYVTGCDSFEVLGIVVDITERKQAEITRDALLEAHADAGVGLLAIKNRRVVFANPATAVMTGYSLDELKAMPDVFAAVVHPDDLELVMQTHKKRLAGDKVSGRYESGIVTKSGERREVEMAVTFTPGSDAFQVIAILIDITERKQLSARLQESHDMLDKFSRQLPGVIFQCRLYPDGHICFPFISETVFDRYGVTAAEFMADPTIVSRFQHPEDHPKTAATFLASAETLQPWRYEYRIVLPQNGVRWILSEANPETLEDGSILWHGFSSDITERKSMEDDLRASDERFRSLTHMGADWYWEQDENFRFTEISGGANFKFHLQGYMTDAIGKTRWELAAGDMEATAWQEHISQVERHEPFRNFEFFRHGDDGEMRVICISGDPLFDDNGRFAGYRGVGSDITERILAEEELRLAALVYENSSEAMSVTGGDGRVITINPAFSKITGYAPEEVIGNYTNIFNVEKTAYVTIKQAVDTVGHWQGEIWNQHKDGDIYPASITINTIFDKNGLPHRYVALFSDITNRKQTEELIWRQANFDALTQLSNRSMFHERVGQEIKKAHRSNTQLALLFIDLDHFKEVNDTLGHDTGDHLLLEAARRIVACVRETDAVARLGGDEFTVLLSGIEDDEIGIVERIAQNILDSLIDPFRLGVEEVYVSASIGITMYPGDADDIEGLFRNADQAMYLSKTHGRNRFSYFTPALQESAQNRLRLITDLRSALSGKQFLVYFQPIVELATGRIVKAEALLRWQHPQRGMVLPGEFIPLAEETGLIHEIGEWVFKESARWVQRWKTNRNSNFQISVNKSPVQFHKDAAGHVAWLAYLTALGLPGQSIAIEITEGVLLNADSSIAGALLGCRDAGIQVAIDDFGTGYSSLAYLNKFDIDYLKIDQSFINNLAQGSSDMALSEAIIVMAHKLGLKVIAEGVETVEQRDLLAAVGCDYVQGYLFARPLPPEEFEALLFSDVRLF